MNSPPEPNAVMTVTANVSSGLSHGRLLHLPDLFMLILVRILILQLKSALFYLFYIPFLTGNTTRFGRAFEEK